MADTELKKSVVAAQVSENEARPVEKKDPSKLLSAFGGFNAVRGFMPDADNLNPAKKAAKAVFLSDKRFKDKRENLINDIKGWLEILDEGHGSATEFVDACKAKEEKYSSVLSQGITDALLQKYIQDSKDLWGGHMERLPREIVGSVVGCKIHVKSCER